MKQRVKFVPNYIQPDNQSTNNMLKCSFEELEKEFTTVHEDALEREKKLVEALREIVKQYRNVRNAEGYPDPLPNSSLPTADALLALYPAPAKEESHD